MPKDFILYALFGGHFFCWDICKLHPFFNKNCGLCPAETINSAIKRVYCRIYAENRRGCGLKREGRKLVADEP